MEKRPQLPSMPHRGPALEDSITLFRVIDARSTRPLITLQQPRNDFDRIDSPLDVDDDLG